MDRIFTHSVKTKIGLLYLASTEKGLSLITLPKTSKKEFLEEISYLCPQAKIEQENSILKDTATQLEKYFAGRLSEFTIPLDIHGTMFQKKVLSKVCKIKYGQTKTYGQIAESVGSPKAYRAVGSANAKNKIPFIIPCHRVVASNSLGGYAGGLKLKEKLLLLERSSTHIK